MIKKMVALFGAIFIVGTAIGLFIHSLNWIIEVFQGHWNILVWGLPPITLMVAYFENVKNGKRFGHTAQIIEEIKNPTQPLHWLLAPWIFLLTLLFHFFGASVGRESTAVQIGASLTESWSRLLKVAKSDRPLILCLGFAAGFGAAFGVPWAGAMFAMETPLLLRKKDWLHFPIYWGASMGAYHWSRFLYGSEHSLWRHIPSPVWNLNGGAYLLAVLFLIGLCWSYEFLFQCFHRTHRKWPWWLLPCAGSLLILLLTHLVSGYQFNNLGVDFIIQSFQQEASLSDALRKLLFTFVSILSGMKGGEVTPLMATGTLFGSWIGSIIPGLNFQVGAALGLVSLFSLRLRIPLTATVMLLEVFDWKMALLGFPLLGLIELGRQRLSGFVPSPSTSD